MRNTVKCVLGGLVAGGLWLGISSAWAEPTLDQVYNATRSGNLSQAQGMMREVLAAHPNSAKAHFVEAEVLARTGDFPAAREELARAQQLDPGMRFANPASVQALRSELSHPAVSPVQAGAVRSEAGSGLSWGSVLVVGGLALFLVVWLVRRQANQTVAYSAAPPMGMGGGYPPGTAGPMGSGPMGPFSPMGGGGSGILGTLATGAALGAGMVAGEALAHRLVDGPESRNIPGAMPAASPDYNPELGGQDFGVNDAGSWDGGGGGDSWDSADSGGSDWS